MKLRQRKRFLARHPARSLWGKRCNGFYYRGCLSCEAYKLYDETGSFPDFELVSAVAHKHNVEDFQKEGQA